MNLLSDFTSDFTMKRIPQQFFRPLEVFMIEPTDVSVVNAAVAICKME